MLNPVEIKALSALQGVLRAYKYYGARALRDFEVKEEVYSLVRRAIRTLKAKAATEPEEDDWSWQCNECDSVEYSSSVSEDDLENLSCGNCGANEFHKVFHKANQH